MIVLVTGGRNFTDRALVHDTLNAINAAHTITMLVQGGAVGADALARSWSDANLPQHALRTFRADWESYGKHAGHVCNREMLQETRPNLVVAFQGGIGTRHMVSIAEKAHVTVIKTWEPGAVAHYLKGKIMTPAWPFDNKPSQLQFVEPTFADYQRIRKDCSWEKENGMAQVVWDGLSDNTKRDVMDQYRRMLNDKGFIERNAARMIEDERELRGKDWGAF